MSITHQLTSLSLYFGIGPDVAILQPVLSACVHLVHLSVEASDLPEASYGEHEAWKNAGPANALRWIPAILDSLDWFDRGPPGGESDLGLLLWLLKTTLPLLSLSSLRHLRFVVSTEENVTGDESWPALRAKCEEKGIEVEFGVLM